MTNAFHVPDDLAKLNITLPEVLAILGIRRKRRTLQARIAALPAREKEMRDDLDTLTDTENELVALATPVEGE